VDWEDTIAALADVGYDKTITLEVFSQDRDYVLLAKSKIERLVREMADRDAGE
jgi:sugar phosphate isomerase/epimerase